MTRRVTLTTYLDAPPDRVWAAANTTSLLRYVAAPLIVFRPRSPSVWPERWADGEYVAAMRFFGVVPVGEQVIAISRPEPRGDVRYLRDDGRGTGIERWDHWITIKPDGAGTSYEDRVEIDAGARTAAVAAFARRFYAHRQGRWRKLVSEDFAPLSEQTA